MIWLYTIAAIAVGVVVVLLTGRWQGAQAPREESPAGRASPAQRLLEQITDEGISGEDLLQVRFDPAVRGYSKAQVDELISALARKMVAAHAADHALLAVDLQQAQFDLAAGGYRMEQVDALLDAVEFQLVGAASIRASEHPRETDQDDISLQ